MILFLYISKFIYYKLQQLWIAKLLKELRNLPKSRLKMMRQNPFHTCQFNPPFIIVLSF
ncbi:hypothetical protein pb186bvf_019996, partial [Paramecium bursaria]